MQASRPAASSHGCAIEKPRAGTAATGPDEAMALTLIVDAAWLALPDVVARLSPAKRWRVSHVELGPATYVKVDFLQIEGRLRLTFPIQTTLPIFNSMSISFLETPQVRT